MHRPIRQSQMSRISHTNRIDNTLFSKKSIDYVFNKLRYEDVLTILSSLQYMDDLYTSYLINNPIIEQKYFEFIRFKLTNIKVDINSYEYILRLLERNIIYVDD